MLALRNPENFSVGERVRIVVSDGGYIMAF